MAALALVVGCSGLSLTPDERAFLRDADPWGLILFGRNVESREQIASLTADFRSAVGRADAPVLIDQEGGRVQRIRPPLAERYPAPRLFTGADPERALALAKLGARLIASDLAPLGITVNCMPNLDLAFPGANEAVIGDRSYGADPERVAAFGRAAAEGLLAGGVLPVIKHLPGHGRATVDSHYGLPVVEAPLDELEAADFLPFRRLAGLPLGMSAHVVYTAIDPDRPGTQSPKVIAEAIRGLIGFDGLLFSDDIGMNALGGDVAGRAAAAFEAGCEVVLQCSGVLADMQAAAGVAPPLAGRALERAEAALALLRPAQDFDVAAAQAELKAGLGLVA